LNIVIGLNLHLVVAAVCRTIASRLGGPLPIRKQASALLLQSWAWPEPTFDAKAEALRAGQHFVGCRQVVHGHAHRLKQRDVVPRFPDFLHSGEDFPEVRVSRVAPDNIPPDAVGVKSSRRKAG